MWRAVTRHKPPLFLLFRYDDPVYKLSWMALA